MSRENDYRLLLEFDTEDRYGEKYSEYRSLNYILKRARGDVEFFVKNMSREIFNLVNE